MGTKQFCRLPVDSSKKENAICWRNLIHREFEVKGKEVTKPMNWNKYFDCAD